MNKRLGPTLGHMQYLWDQILSFSSSHVVVFVTSTHIASPLWSCGIYRLQLGHAFRFWVQTLVSKGMLG